MKQFNGSDEYWSRATAAHLGWPQNQPPKPNPNRSRVGNAGQGLPSQILGGAAGLPPEPEFEARSRVDRRQFDDYLVRNPGYRSTYEAELRKRCYATLPKLTILTRLVLVHGELTMTKLPATPTQIGHSQAPESQTGSVVRFVIAI